MYLSKGKSTYTYTYIYIYCTLLVDWLSESQFFYLIADKTNEDVSPLIQEVSLVLTNWRALTETTAYDTALRIN